jgi:hypothetical protein
MMWMWVMSPCIAMAQAVPTTNGLLPFSLRAYKKNILQAEAVTALAAAGAFQTVSQYGAHAENHYMLKDMGTAGMAIQLPRQYGGLGLAGQFNGGRIASSLAIGANMALKLQEQLGIGIGMRLTGFKWAGQPLQWGIQAKGGMLYWITPKTAIGFQLEEWLPIGADKEKTRSRFQEIITGMGTSVNNNVYLAMEIRKRTGEQPGIGGLLEWQLDSAIGARAGINTSNNMLSLGLTKKKGKNAWGLDLGNHPQLGFSSCITLSHVLGE